MTSETKTALERAFSYFGADHSAPTLQAAARELLDSRRKQRAAIARDLWAKRAGFAAHCRTYGIKPDSAFRATLSRGMREDVTRYAYPRATLPSLRRELASLRYAKEARRSESYRARMNSLPCGLQDAEDERRAADETMARLIPRMIRIIERESR